MSICFAMTMMATVDEDPASASSDECDPLSVHEMKRG